MAESATTRRLTLVAAPAGFGKTAALARLIEHLGSGVAVAWVAADHNDDASVLTACLIAALEPFDPPWRTDTDVLVSKAGGSPAERLAVAGLILNALDACEVHRGLIVVDDAHRVVDQDVFELLDALLERLPSQWSLIIASRTEPAIASLARLRAHGELGEFRQDALRFGLDEARALMPPQMLIANVDAEAATRLLVERTHGWAVGLRLAVSGLAPGQPPGVVAANDSARDRHVFDYLVSEVLDDLPKALRLFLLRTSVLTELTSQRCAAVSGDARAAEWLDEIERRGLFASMLQATETTLRLHDLFRDFLQERLRREMPAEISGLHRRAAAGEPDTVRRIGHLLRAGDADEAERALMDAAPAVITTLGAAPAVHMLELFSSERQAGSPVLAHVRCLCAWSRWDWGTMLDAARKASAGFDQRGDVLAAWRSRIYEAIALFTFGRHDEALANVADAPASGLTPFDRARVGMVQLFVALDRGQLGEVAERFSAVLDEIEPSHDPMTWYQCVPPSLQCGLPRLGTTMRRFARGALRAAPDTPTPLRAIALSAIGWADLWAGQVSRAAAQAALADTDARWLGSPANVAFAVDSLLALLAAMQGRITPSRQALDRIALLFDRPSAGYDRTSALYGFYRLFEIRLADIAGERALVLAMARDLQQTALSIGNGTRPLLDAQRHALPGRVAWNEGRWADARTAFNAALVHHTAMEVFGEADEIRLRLGLACLRLNDTKAAAQAVLAVIAQQARFGGISGALTLGRDGLSELASANWQDLLGTEDRAVIEGWAASLTSVVDSPLDSVDVRDSSLSTSVGGLRAATRAETAGLTRRELEVLTLISNGESNKLIARTFDLSPHTVKRHVANILDKLCVESRGQAAAFYREHLAGSHRH